MTVQKNQNSDLKILQDKTARKRQGDDFFSSPFLMKS
jgi:hypothetical protein